VKGQFDVPACEGSKVPSVLLVGGTGLFTRTGNLGRSGTPRDEVFTDLTKRFNAHCIAVARFDYRGVNCESKTKEDVAKCIDQNLRAKVTPETILDDIQVVFDHLERQAFFDPKRVILIGHSEGSLNIARLLERKSVGASGLLFFGGMTESANGILRWQLAERPLEWAFEMDADHNGILTNDEIKNGFSRSHFAQQIPVENLLSPTGSWTRESLGQVFEDGYKATESKAMATSDESPYVLSDIVFSSYKWWKQWFTDKKSVLESLKDFEGPIEYHNGDIDSQTPGRRERKFLDAIAFPMRSRPRFILHAGKGHTLSSDPLFGPIDEAIADELVQTVVGWTRPSSKRQLRSSASASRIPCATARTAADVCASGR
jgi:pimeloyl-ACP methyl ester carboxylesterase